MKTSIKSIASQVGRIAIIKKENLNLIKGGGTIVTICEYGSGD